jgi:hypothetical protein
MQEAVESVLPPAVRIRGNGEVMSCNIAYLLVGTLEEGGGGGEAMVACHEGLGPYIVYNYRQYYYYIKFISRRESGPVAEGRLWENSHLWVLIMHC